MRAPRSAGGPTGAEDHDVVFGILRRDARQAKRVGGNRRELPHMFGRAWMHSMRGEKARIRGDVIGLVRQHFEGQLIEASPKSFVPRAALDESAHPGMQPCALVGRAVHHWSGGVV